MNEFEEYKNILDNEHRTDNLRDSLTAPDENQILETDRWTGYVIDNNDPMRLGRVQIRIIGTYDDIPDHLLPWAVPDIGFIGTMRGSFIIPENQTCLRGYFDKGDIQKPIYDSMAYSKSNLKSWYTGRAQGLDYPNKIVFFETNQGDYLTLNRSNGELVFTHRTGAQTKISSNGDISINTGILSVGSKLNVTVQGNANITSLGKTTINGNRGVSIESTNPVAKIQLGNNEFKQKVNNLTSCLICGAPHCIGNTQVEV